LPKKMSKKSKRRGTHLRFRYMIESGETVIKATNQLIAWSLQGEISSRNFGAINNAIGNILKVIIPHEPPQVTVTINLAQELRRILPTLPSEDDQLVVAKAISTLDKQPPS